MKIKILIISFFFLISMNASAAVNWQGAAAEVEESIDQMLKKVMPYKGQVNANLEPLYKDLAVITEKRVDYPYLSKIVMGKHYRRANAKQKKEFEAVFKRTLIKTYAKTLVSFDIKKHELVKSRAKSPKADKQKVVLKVVSTAGKSYSIINYMVHKKGSWKLVNIVLDGFNLRVTFKNQFNSIVQKSKGDLSKAIGKWSQIMSKK